MEEKNFHTFEEHLGVVFRNKELLRQAFIHRSYLNESRETLLNHNERLEFLGDAVLELVVTDHLFKTYRDKSEGELTAYRSALVNTLTLAQVATDLDMNAYLFLSKGEARDTGRARQYILADTFEAFVGALYLDLGFSEVQAFIGRTLLPRLPDIIKHRLWQDAKSYFQEIAQEHVGITPTYRTIKETGPDHDKLFVIGVYLDDDLIAQGEGRSKQEAEQRAAERALETKDW
jgi:ribonuclease III